jgi:arsenate reductase
VQHRLHWKFDDPAAFEGSDEDKLNEFRRVRDEIDAKVSAWVAEMREKL